ncbi:hypothetical protein [Pseudomonas juntendi]|uniref:hypothetical protein n=1 Tax=Pseudomonas juntendi TaxID=2666183 RepID=UPI00294A18DF|nr:hypothetical protein [Pseudomonas juntendi]MDV5387702.1 hypothetical protein [Pseudomonas juntendi]
MDDLVGVLCLGVGVATWWWLAGRMKKRGSGWLTRQVAGSFACCFMVVAIAGIAVSTGVVDSKTPRQARTSVEAEPELTPQASEVKSLQMTPPVYAARINALLEQFEKPYRVNPAEISTGDVTNVLKAELGPFASLILTVAKDTGDIVDVMLIGVGDGSPSSGVEIMPIGTAALSAAAPEANHRNLFKRLPEMMRGISETYGQVESSIKSTDQMGTWFMAAPI